MWLYVYFRKRKSLEKAIDASWRLLNYNKWEMIKVIKNNNKQQQQQQNPVQMLQEIPGQEANGRWSRLSRVELRGGQVCKGEGQCSGSIAQSVTSHILTSRLQLWNQWGPEPTSEWGRRGRWDPSQAPLAFPSDNIVRHTSLFSQYLLNIS